MVLPTRSLIAAISLLPALLLVAGCRSRLPATPPPPPPSAQEPREISFRGTIDGDLSPEDWGDLSALAGVDLVHADPELRRSTRFLHDRIFPAVRRDPGFILGAVFSVGAGKGEGGLVVVEMGNDDYLPSECYARIRFYGPDHAPYGRVDFLLGWRQGPTRIALRSDPPLKRRVLETETRRSRTDTTGLRSYFALAPPGAVLVRLEDLQGNPCSPCFDGDRIGPPPPTRSPARWERALCFSGEFEVLRSLMWMSEGVSRDARGRLWKAPWLVDFLDRPSARLAVGVLTTSRDPWIRDQARLVLGLKREEDKDLTEP